MAKFKLMHDGERYIEICDGGYSAEILEYGATLKSLFVPDRNGVFENIVCGFDTLADYKKSGGSFGATVGRCCNRISNSRFTIDGEEYVLSENDGVNHLHGGKAGFGRRMWTLTSHGENFAELALVSEDGDMGYPGELAARVKYTLSDGKLTMDWYAKCDKKTPVNMTNHAYFDICGAYSGRAGEATLQINGDEISVTDKKLIPNGERRSVFGTPYDFTSAKPVWRDMNSDDELLQFLGGYDTNYFIRGEGMRVAAVLFDEISGRRMTLSTNQPCMQLYTANTVGDDEPSFAGGHPQKVHCGICLEVQGAPDAVNRPEFPSVIISPGEEYHRCAVLDFNA